jgi:hypothetical protein
MGRSRGTQIGPGSRFGTSSKQIRESLSFCLPLASSRTLVTILTNRTSYRFFPVPRPEFRACGFQSGTDASQSAGAFSSNSRCSWLWREFPCLRIRLDGCEACRKRDAIAIAMRRMRRAGASKCASCRNMRPAGGRRAAQRLGSSCPLTRRMRVRDCSIPAARSMRSGCSRKHAKHIGWVEKENRQARTIHPEVWQGFQEFRRWRGCVARRHSCGIPPVLRDRSSVSRPQPLPGSFSIRFPRAFP